MYTSNTLFHICYCLLLDVSGLQRNLSTKLECKHFSALLRSESYLSSCACSSLFALVGFCCIHTQFSPKTHQRHRGFLCSFLEHLLWSTLLSSTLPHAFCLTASASLNSDLTPLFNDTSVLCLASLPFCHSVEHVSRQKSGIVTEIISLNFFFLRNTVL